MPYRRDAIPSPNAVFNHRTNGVIAAYCFASVCGNAALVTSSRVSSVHAVYD